MCNFSTMTKSSLGCICLFSKVNCFRGHVSFLRNARSYSKFVRTPTRVYVPGTDGIVPARKSIAKLPDEKKQVDNVQGSKTSGEIFKSVMGDIFISKNKHLIAVEGARQVNDAISFGLKLRTLFLLKALKTYPDNVRKLIDNAHEVGQNSWESKSTSPEIHRISLGVLQEWSALDTPPGIIGIFEKPKTIVTSTSAKQKLPLTVILDNIREPGNLGSIMRTAAGIGCKVLLSVGCTDPWETKALRGGNGAQFLVPMTTQVEFQYLHQYVPLPDLTPQDLSSTSSSSNVDLDQKSLTSRQGIGVFLADSGTEPDEYGIPIVDYTSVEYSKFRSIVLALGGETSGLSKAMKKSVSELPNYYPDEIKCVSRIKIPMALPIDSLNVANAFGIVGYEIWRQMSINRN